MGVGIQNIVALDQEKALRQSACGCCMRRAVCPVFSAVRVTAGWGSGAPIHKSVHAGQTLVNSGDPFDGFYLVKSGFFKSSFIDSDGMLQVTGFHLPGEMFGTDGLDAGTHDNFVEALDTGSACKIPFSLPACSGGMLWNTNTMLAMMKIMSGALATSRSEKFALGKLSANRRFAGFLMDMSRRMERSGYSPAAFRLCMSRNDIANYLCLAVETVSRLFTRFQAQGFIHIVRRDLEITDRKALRAIVDGAYEGEWLFDKAS